MKETLWTKPFILLILSNLFLFLSLEMLLPTLPMFAAEKGGTDAQIGLIIGLFTFSAVLLRPFVGMASDKFGKKLLLLVGVAICLIGTASYYAAVTITMMLMLRIVHGVGFGISTTLYGTVASDIIPASRRGEGMGFFGTGNAVAISLGPFLGIWLMEEYGFSALFIVGACILLLAIVFTAFVKGDTKAERVKVQAAAERTSFMLRFVEPKALMPSLLGLLVGLSLGGVISFITLFGKETGVQNIGFFFLVLALSEFLIRFVSGRIFDTKGRFWVLFPAAVSCIIGCIILYMTKSTGTLLLAAVFYGAGFGAIFPGLQAWVIDRVEPGRRGVATATFYNAFDIGIGSGAMLLGLVATWSNYATMYLVSSVFFIVYLAVYFMYERKLKQGRQSKLETH
ncbi:MFS family permease [Paenibacillus endophyticus]|uniref:MFS family permease n=1 Tax=Paenibacillus endophyticus TaxID=1294268 RepID=A0A7W5GB23_9BACL|nr:MFS transporter [Paenibacillus endophyticus]MBB3153340.1 MFS family permease [Paenibacillus endophyticus]